MCNYTILAFACGCRTAAGVRLESLCAHPSEGCARGPHVLVLPRRCDDAGHHPRGPEEPRLRGFDRSLDFCCVLVMR